MARKNDKLSKDLKNLKMDKDVYKLKREVMTFIYEIKSLLSNDFPRVTVRVIENGKKSDNSLAWARYNENIIWVKPVAINQADYDLRTIVYHEVLHTVFEVKHYKNCPLMKPIHTPLTKEECQRIFMEYVNRGKEVSQLAA